MSLKTLMVHLEVGRTNPGLLRLAQELANGFEADVIGIAGCQPMQLYYGDGYITGDLIQQDRETIDRDLNTAEAAFRAAFHDHAGKVDWRTCVTFLPLSDYIAREARSADLIITGVTRIAPFSATRRVSAGDLVMQAGRPVLIVPAKVGQLNLKRAVVAWKDTREARRAVLDALPLLKASGHVTVLGVALEESLTHVIPRLEDVVGWLKRHGVAATALALPSKGDDASRLYDIVQNDGADLVVAGAYGHNRLREWAFGGVTTDLLLCDDQCVLLSH
jgi:nucleotide-binding universal stress UspA family protein